MQSTESVSLVSIPQHPSQIKEEKKELSIFEIVSPSITGIIEPPFSIENPQDVKATDQLLARYKEATKGFEWPHLATIHHLIEQKGSLNASGQDAFKATIEIIEELSRGSYTKEAASIYLQWVSTLFLNHLQGGAIQMANKIEAMKNKILHDVTFTEEVVDRDKPKMYFLRSEQGQPIMLLKEARKIPTGAEVEAAQLDGTKVKVTLPLKRSDERIYNSFIMQYPQMPITSKIFEHEVIGGEIDALFGLSRTPITCYARFGSSEAKPLEGTLQEFVQDGQLAAETYIFQPNRAKELLPLDASKVHLTGITGIFEGWTAHHYNNFMIRAEGDKAIDIVAIDQEENMPPFNRPPRDMTPTTAFAIAQEREAILTQPQTPENLAKLAKIESAIETIKKTFVLGRIWVMGLPQSKKVFERALLMTLCHPSMKALLKAYHENVLKKQGKLHPAAIQAHAERLESLQSLSRAELVKERVSATPQDFYFSIFGGEELYKICKEKGYPDSWIFNQLLADPYPLSYKNFACPKETLPQLPPLGSKSSPARLNLEVLQQG